MSEQRVLPCNVRFAEAQDERFVKDSWAKSWFSGPNGPREPLRHMDRRDFDEFHRVLMDRLIAASATYVATNVEDPAHIYGWLCMGLFGEAPVIHYIYTKQNLRRWGVAKRLLATALPDGYLGRGPLLYTHHTNHMGWLKKPWNLTYNPYILTMTR